MSQQSKIKRQSMSMTEFITNSAEETITVGRQIGMALADNSVICLFGELGTGKTTFVKGLASKVVDCDDADVNSPTFVYLNIYEGKRTIFHFDLYRLKGPDDFVAMGFDEYFSAGGICCIEWSERISSCLPEGYIRVEMEHFGENKRRIVIK